MGRQRQRVEIRRKGWPARDGGGDGAKLTGHNGGADGMRTANFALPVNAHLMRGNAEICSGDDSRLDGGAATGGELSAVERR
uniref:Uncharacterized protein n=1 Tax=Oryza meridionalis TaxID=40149 RepID=A0A0E0C275_9ORYZ